MTRKNKRRAAPSSTYTYWNMLLASPTEPIPQAKRDHQLGQMKKAIAAMEQGEHPTVNDWRMLSDAVNLLETLVRCGPWRDCDGDLVDFPDTSGLLNDAISAMDRSATRLLAGKPIRLDGPGIQAMRAVLDDYSAAIEALPAREVIKCHMMAEKRLRAAMQDIPATGGVRVVAI